MLDSWQYDENYLEWCLYAARLLNKNRFDAWSEKVLLSQNYPEYVISETLSINWKQAPEFLQKYPQIMRYQNDSSLVIREGFSDFVSWFEKQKALNILHNMQNTETNKNAKQYITHNIQWCENYCQ